jgi:hypothetical protein
LFFVFNRCPWAGWSFVPASNMAETWCDTPDNGCDIDYAGYLGLINCRSSGLTQPVDGSSADGYYPLREQYCLIPESLCPLCGKIFRLHFVTCFVNQ